MPRIKEKKERKKKRNAKTGESRNESTTREKRKGSGEIDER